MFLCFPFKKKSKKKEEGSELLRKVSELKGEKESKEEAEARKESEKKCSEAVIESETSSEAGVGSEKLSEAVIGREKMSEAGVEGEKISEKLKGGSKKPTKDGMNSVQACLAAHRRFVRSDSAISVSKSEETSESHKKTENTKDGVNSLQACLAARRRFVRPDSATSVSEFEEDPADEMMGAQENDGPGPSGGKKKLLTSSLAPQFRRKNLPRKKTEKEDRDAD